MLIVQNDLGNQHSPTVIAAVITGQIKHRYLPTHVLLEAPGCGLLKKSMVMLEQLRTLDNSVLRQTGAAHAKIVTRERLPLLLQFGILTSQ